MVDRGERLVVRHLAGEEAVAPLRDGGVHKRAARPRADAHAGHGLAAPRDLHHGHAQRGAHPLGDFVEACGGIERDRPPAAAVKVGRLGEGHDVVGGFFVRVRGAQRDGRFTEQVCGADHLEAQLRRALERAGPPDRGVRARAADERAYPGRGERAFGVRADHPGADRGERSPDRVGRRLGHERHELHPLGSRRVRRERAQVAPRFTLTQRRPCKPRAQTVGRCVERGVRREDRGARAHQAQDAALAVRCVGEALEGLEDGGVIRDDGARTHRDRFGSDGRGQVDRDEDGAVLELVGVGADEQADVVPVLGEVGWCDTVERAGELAGGGHGASLPAVARAITDLW